MLACLCTVSGGTHPVYILLVSSKGGTRSGEGLWCAKTSNSDMESITWLVHSHFAFPHSLVWLPEAAKILAALLHYTSKWKWWQSYAQANHPKFLFLNYPRSSRARKQMENNVCVGMDLPVARMDRRWPRELGASALKLFHLLLLSFSPLLA